MNKIPSLIISFFAFFLSNTLIFAETGPLGWGTREHKEDMETDRPDFTEGTQTIQPGHMQFELGYTYTRDKADSLKIEEHIAPELLMRIGIINDLEFRYTWGGYISNELNDLRDEGVTDTSLGFKQRIFRQNEARPDLSLIGELFVPTGSSTFSANKTEPVIKLLWAYSFNGFAIAGNLNFSYLSGEEERYTEVANALTIGIDLSENLATYLEYYGLYPTTNVIERTEHIINGGFTYALSDDIQLDIRSGFGLNYAAPNFFSGLGLTFRI